MHCSDKEMKLNEFLKCYLDVSSVLLRIQWSGIKQSLIYQSTQLHSSL